MSYRKTYTGYVHYSGTVDYPASDTGGTASYSGSEPVYITIDVDTAVFDASIAHCNTAVNGLTTAVVATEAAQVEAERVTSRKIANSIVKGFFDYVGADLTQKIKELVSKCESVFLALIGYKENCLAKSKQMQEDYHRISRRYSKIFEDLDRETASRIKMLDKHTFRFAETAQDLIDRSSNTDLLGISTITANESIRLETILSCSHIKRQGKILLEKANNYLQGTYRIINSVSNLLEDTQLEGVIMLPMMFVESVVNSEKKETKVIGAKDQYAPSGEFIDSQLCSKFMSKELEWVNMDSRDFEKVISYLNADVQAAQMEDRTLKTMLGLLNNQVIQTIKA